MNREVLAKQLMVGDKVTVMNYCGDVIGTEIDADTLRDLVAVESGAIGTESPSWKTFEPVPLDEASLLADGFKVSIQGETYIKDLRFLRVLVDLVDEKVVVLERKYNVRDEAPDFRDIINVSAKYWHDLQHALAVSKLA